MGSSSHEAAVEASATKTAASMPASTSLGKAGADRENE
jgi:hypothetical protein